MREALAMAVANELDADADAAQRPIAIIGGGIIGSFAAYFLAQAGAAGDVVVIEPDPSYELASTPKGAGGVRQLFSRPENIEMSKFSIDFYRHFSNSMAVEGDGPADIDFNQRGYLFVVGPDGARQLEANFERQERLGVPVELLSRSDLADRYPSLGLDDVRLGCLSAADATITTALALQHLRRKVESLGVAYIDAQVMGLGATGNRVQSAQLDNGTAVRAEAFVNAAGAWAPQVAAMVGMRLPIEPMCRVKHAWTSPTPVEPLPLVKDESGLFFRPQGDGFVGGRPPFEIRPGFSFLSENAATERFFADYFETTVRPLLTKRLPAFESAIETESWTGHYAQNTLDGNMILGPWIDVLPNFYVACGFSGHGIMHAPAVGRAVAELVLTGASSSIDLERMSYQRVVENSPYPEEGIV